MQHTITVTDENGTTTYEFNNGSTVEECLRILQGAAARIEFVPHKPQRVVVKERTTLLREAGLHYLDRRRGA